MSLAARACTIAAASLLGGAAAAQWLDLDAPPVVGDAALARAASLADSLLDQASEERRRAAALEEGSAARTAASARASWRELAAQMLTAPEPSRSDAKGTPRERNAAYDLAFGVRLVGAMPSLDALAAALESRTAPDEQTRRATSSLDAFVRSVDRLAGPAGARRADGPMPDWRREVAWPFDAASALEEAVPADPWPASGGRRASAGEARAMLARAGLSEAQAGPISSLLDTLDRAEHVPVLRSLAGSEIDTIARALVAAAPPNAEWPIGSEEGSALIERMRESLRQWALAHAGGAGAASAAERMVAHMGDLRGALDLAAAAESLGMPAGFAKDAGEAAARASETGLTERGARALVAMRDVLDRAARARSASRGREASGAGRLAWRTLGEAYSRAESAAVRESAAALRDPSALERPATISAISVHADLGAGMLRAARMIEFAEALSVERRTDPASGEAATALRSVLDGLGDDAQRAWALRRLERIERVERQVDDALRALEGLSRGGPELAALRTRVEPALVEGRAAWRRTWDDGADAPDPSPLARLALALADARSALEGAPSIALALRWPGLPALEQDVRDEAARAAREITERLSAAVGASPPEREMLAQGAEAQFAVVRLVAAVGRSLDGLGAASQSGATGALARLAVEPGEDVWMGDQLAALDEIGALLFQTAEAERTESAGAAAEARERAAPLCEAALRAVEAAHTEGARR